MRDQVNGKVQVTIMNDRPQAGTADLTDKANIELMQQRRQPGDSLNDPVAATYRMQIFDRKFGKSLQREEQIKIDQPLLYFFAFEYSEFNLKKEASLVQLDRYTELAQPDF